MESLPAPVLSDTAPEVDLRRVWATIARSAWLILGCVLLSLGAGVVAVRRMDPVYQATASIRLDARGANATAALYGVQSDNVNLMATAQEVMTSRSLASEVADSLGLRLKVDEPRRTPRSKPGRHSRDTFSRNARRFDCARDLPASYRLRQQRRPHQPKQICK